MQSLRAVNRKVVAGFENGFFNRVSITYWLLQYLGPHFNQTINWQLSNFDKIYFTPKGFIYFFVKFLLLLPKLLFSNARMQIVFQICGFQFSILCF